jgi:hypothetical protein
VYAAWPRSFGRNEAAHRRVDEHPFRGTEVGRRVRR